ncbi:MAG: DUF4186 domain-containing protein [Bacilli bacterium]|nr:DUF4186 domain-containing protein [Bacilli bacterium]
MYRNLDELFYRLSKSKFRSSFHLNHKMKEYVKTKGLDEIERHAYEFIDKRLKPSLIPNDGRQTPMKQTHPVFISQHATATCCRKCLYRWHGIDINKTLNKDEVDYIVRVIMKWIKSEL